MQGYKKLLCVNQQNPYPEYVNENKNGTGVSCNDSKGEIYHEDTRNP